jgi:hypothetical protein
MRRLRKTQRGNAPLLMIEPPAYRSQMKPKIPTYRLIYLSQQFSRGNRPCAAKYAINSMFSLTIAG